MKTPANLVAMLRSLPIAKYLLCVAKLAGLHHEKVGGGSAGVEPIRAAAGAGTNTRDNPQLTLEQWQPEPQKGGWLDRKQPPPALTSGK